MTPPLRDMTEIVDRAYFVSCPNDFLSRRLCLVIVFYFILNCYSYLYNYFLK